MVEGGAVEGVVEEEASQLRAGVEAGLMGLVEGGVGYHIPPSRNPPYWSFRVGRSCPVH